MEDVIQQIYEETLDPITNKVLYGKLSKMGFNTNEYGPIGSSRKRHNLFYRKVRWAQQSLRKKSLLTRVGDNCWSITENRKIKLHAIDAANCVLAMSTNLGVAIWGRSELVGKRIIDEPVHLVLTSMPYPLKVVRAYGNTTTTECIDFVSSVLEPWVDNLAPGGSIALNISNDIFESRSPARSTYLEEMTLALKKRFGLELMDRMPWVSNKAPGPIQWASLKRTQLNVGFEFVLWFTNDPLKCFSNNQRVLSEHSEQHKKLIAKGGMAYSSAHGDGNYKKPEGAFGNQTKGRIPTNVLNYSNYCHSGRKVTQYARSIGVPPHAAKYPVSLCKFLIEFLTEPNQLVADVFGGTLTTGEAAESLGRRWVCVEMMWEYIRQAFPRFETLTDDVYWNPRFLRHFKTKTD